MHINSFLNFRPTQILQNIRDCALLPSSSTPVKVAACAAAAFALLVAVYTLYSLAQKVFSKTNPPSPPFPLDKRLNPLSPIDGFKYLKRFSTCEKVLIPAGQPIDFSGVGSNEVIALQKGDFEPLLQEMNGPLFPYGKAIVPPNWADFTVKVYEVNNPPFTSQTVTLTALKQMTLQATHAPLTITLEDMCYYMIQAKVAELKLLPKQTLTIPLNAWEDPYSSDEESEGPLNLNAILKREIPTGYLFSVQPMPNRQVKAWLSEKDEDKTLTLWSEIEGLTIQVHKIAKKKPPLKVNTASVKLSNSSQKSSPRTPKTPKTPKQKTKPDLAARLKKLTGHISSHLKPSAATSHSHPAVK